MIDKLVRFIYSVYDIIIGLLLLTFVWIALMDILPIKYKYYSEVQLGNTLIEQINLIDTNLPEEEDWLELERIGFEREYDIDKPRYNKVSENEFELVFFIGFDGPHLVWNSIEKVWKMGFPKR